MLGRLAELNIVKIEPTRSLSSTPVAPARPAAEAERVQDEVQVTQRLLPVSGPVLAFAGALALGISLPGSGVAEEIAPPLDVSVTVPAPLPTKPDQQFIQLTSRLQDSATLQNLNSAWENGRLRRLDPDGISTMQHLHRLLTQTLAPGLDHDVLLKELAAALAEPGEINQQGAGTCGITSVEYIHSQEDPSDWVRVLAGLSSQEGHVHLRDGTLLQRNPTGLANDKFGRNNIDRLYQSSMSELFNGDNRYDNQQDLNLDAQGKSTGRGLPRTEVARALSSIFGQPYEYDEYKGDRHETDQDLRLRLADGQRVWISINWVADLKDAPISHAIALEAVHGDSVSLRNPQGLADDGSGGAPRHLVDKNGHFVMSKADFYARLNGTIQAEGRHPRQVAYLSSTTAVWPGFKHS